MSVAKSQTNRRLRAVLLGFVAAGLAVPPAARTEASTSITAAEAMDAVMWSEEPIGGAFRLQDSAGRTVTEADFRGKIVVVYFGFTWCPDVCPTDMMAMGGALDMLGAAAEEVQPIFITMDPERDDEVLDEYVSAFHERFVGLTGDEAAIRETANAFKVYYRKVPTGVDDEYTIDHTAFTYLYDRSGDYLGFLPPGTPAQLFVQVLQPLISP